MRKEDTMTSDIDSMPGGNPELVKRELHFYWLLDTSGSMSNGGKIQSLNHAIRESIPYLRKEADDPKARGELIVHAMEFNDHARWVDAEMAEGVAVSKFNWTKDLEANGETYMGEALKQIAAELPNLPNNAFRPVIALVTDGEPTDNFQQGLKELMDQPWGKHAWRVAIAIGDDANMKVCEEFCGGERKPMKATNVEDIGKFIRWVSNVVGAGAAKGDKAIEDELNKQPPALAAVPTPTIAAATPPGGIDTWAVGAPDPNDGWIQ